MDNHMITKSDQMKLSHLGTDRNNDRLPKPKFKYKTYFVKPKTKGVGPNLIWSDQKSIIKYLYFNLIYFTEMKNNNNMALMRG